MIPAIVTQVHPLLYQVNTRVLLHELGRGHARAAALDRLPDAFLDEVRARGFTWFWPLGVWETTAASREVSLSDPALRRSARDTLPDLSDRDITGSPFAISAYRARAEWGGRDALARLRARLAARGIRLLLDFVPNHTGLGHAWVDEHPEYYVRGTLADLARAPANYIRVRSRGEEVVLAHGRDPFFPGWPDTLQLDYRHAGLRRAMREQLLRVAAQCDGVRCDMAMLLQPDVFAHTWPGAPADGSAPVHAPFWGEAIGEVRRAHREFLFMAEVYWGREWELQQEGFDYTYDKDLYDRLRAGRGQAVHEHLLAEPLYQRRSVRFLENHDEPRAAAVFPFEVHQAAAVVTFFVPGLRFFHEGQLEGRRAFTSMHVGRRPEEEADPRPREFYSRLLACLRRSEVHAGRWRLWECRAAWGGNETWRNLIVMTWQEGERLLLVAVNYAAHAGQGYVALNLPELAGQHFTLMDRMGPARYEREGDALRTHGLYLDMPAWGYHVFELQPQSSN